MAETADDIITYTFKIEGYTPNDMSFGRLLEYYQEVKKMLGMADSLHLIEVAEGSLANVFSVDRDNDLKLKDVIEKINSGTAPKNALRARDKINLMLQEDGTSAIFSDPNNDNVISFPGVRRDEGSFLRIRDAASFSGELYYIAGTKSDAKVRIHTERYGSVYCVTTIKLAKQLREYLFEQVKVNGVGVWTRLDDDNWKISDFTITSFIPLKRETLREAVDRLRAFEVEWPEDVLCELRKIEEKDGQV